jgi:hypothetical protein
MISNSKEGYRLRVFKNTALMKIFRGERERKEVKHGENEMLRSFIIHTFLLLVLGPLKEE